MGIHLFPYRAPSQGLIAAKHENEATDVKPNFVNKHCLESSEERRKKIFVIVFNCHISFASMENNYVQTSSSSDSAQQLKKRTSKGRECALYGCPIPFIL